MIIFLFGSADGKGIAEYTAEEFAEKLLPRLDEAQVKISSMGSPIGKIQIDSEEDFEKQKAQLEEICKMCNMSGCRYIRMSASIFRRTRIRTIIRTK